MALTINTNMLSLKTQHALNSATNSMNKSIERMTTGYKINSAKDDAAGLAVATRMETKLSALSVAESNVELGTSLLNTIEGNYGVMQDHLQRIRDLTEQAANGTYSSDSLKAIKSEINQRLDEITRVAKSTEYNDMYLLDGTNTSLTTNGLNIQAGVTSSKPDSVITLDKSLFASCLASSLTWKTTNAIKDDDGVAVTLSDYGVTTQDTFATACAGLYQGGTDASKKGTNAANKMLAVIDTALKDISDRTTTLGSIGNRLDSASDALTVQGDNLTSSLSTVRDADVASESSSYISAQILQQASATLLATANQTPSIALNLI